MSDYKMYYSIGEVARLFGINETTLRFWEKEFPQISPQKTAGNVRRYTKKDVEQVKAVHHLVKVRGLKIAAARDVLSKNKSGTMQTAEAVERLRAIREELVRMRQEMGELE